MSASVRSPHNTVQNPQWLYTPDGFDFVDDPEYLSGIVWEMDKLGLTDSEMWAVVTLAPDCEISFAGTTFKRVHKESEI